MEIIVSSFGRGVQGLKKCCKEHGDPQVENPGVVTASDHRSKTHGRISPVKAGFALENRKSQRHWLEKRNIHLFSVLYLKGFNNISFPGTCRAIFGEENRILGVCFL